MNNKVKMTFLACFMVALVASVYFVGFYHAMYWRNAELNIDIGTYSLHVTVFLQRADWEEPIFWSHHAGVLTNVGKDFIEGKLFNSAFANGTQYADDISLSTDASSPSATWCVIPNEITTGGLDRQTGTYASTGVGTCTVSKQFTASATHTNVQLTGLNWGAADQDNSLLGADTFTPVTLNSGDKLTVTWTLTIS